MNIDIIFIKKNPFLLIFFFVIVKIQKLQNIYIIFFPIFIIIFILLFHFYINKEYKNIYQIIFRHFPLIQKK